MINNLIIYNEYFEMFLQDKYKQIYIFIFDISLLNKIKQYKWNISKYGKDNKLVRPIARIKNKSIYIKNILFENYNNSVVFKFKNGNSCDYRSKNIICKFKHGNPFCIVNDYVILYTNNNEKIFIDIEDFSNVSNYTWSLDGRGYVVGRIGDKTVYLHRIIMSYYTDILELIIDHKNHRGNDNRKHNLRICTISENEFNSALAINNTSGYTGVSYDEDNCKWAASIQANNVRIRLGLFSDINDAIKVRSEYEEKLFGEFSYKNSMGCVVI